MVSSEICVPICSLENLLLAPASVAALQDTASPPRTEMHPFMSWRFIIQDRKRTWRRWKLLTPKCALWFGWQQGLIQDSIRAIVHSVLLGLVIMSGFAITKTIRPTAKAIFSRIWYLSICEPVSSFCSEATFSSFEQLFSPRKIWVFAWGVAVDFVPFFGSCLSLSGHGLWPI